MLAPLRLDPLQHHTNASLTLHRFQASESVQPSITSSLPRTDMAMAQPRQRLSERPTLTIITESEPFEISQSMASTPSKTKRKRTRQRKRPDTPTPYNGNYHTGNDRFLNLNVSAGPGDPVISFLTLTPSPRGAFQIPTPQQSFTHPLSAAIPSYVTAYTPTNAIPQSPSPLTALLMQRSLLLSQSSDLRLSFLHAEAMHTVLSSPNNSSNAPSSHDTLGISIGTSNGSGIGTDGWGDHGKKVGLLADEMRTLLASVMRTERLLSEVEAGVQRALIVEMLSGEGMGGIAEQGSGWTPSQEVRSASELPAKTVQFSPQLQTPATYTPILHSQAKAPVLPPIKRFSTLKLQSATPPTPTPTNRKSVAIVTPSSTSSAPAVLQTSHSAASSSTAGEAEATVEAEAAAASEAAAACLLAGAAAQKSRIRRRHTVGGGAGDRGIRGDRGNRGDGRNRGDVKPNGEGDGGRDAGKDGWRPPTPYPTKTRFGIPQVAREVRVLGRGKGKAVRV